MHIKKDDVPLVAYPHDELWVAFRDQPAQTMLWLSSVSDGATVEIWSGATEDVSLMTLRTTVNLTYRNHISLTDLVGAGVLLTDQFVRIRPNGGRVEATLAGPGQFRHYMKSLIV
jgi:hypothetical protein